MNNLTLTARSLHKQRMHELMEEARIERFLTDRKKARSRSLAAAPPPALPQDQLDCPHFGDPGASQMRGSLRSSRSSADCPRYGLAL